MKLHFLLLPMVAVLLLFSEWTQNAQAQSSDNDYYMSSARWGVGAQAGLMSGMGVGVRYHPRGRFGLQIAGGGISGGEGLAAAVGIEGQFDFDWRERSRFFGFIGMGYYTNGEEELTFEEWQQGKEDPRLESPFRAGLGLGYEWDISRMLIFTANIVFTYFSSGSFLPLPQIGLYYLFD